MRLFISWSGHLSHEVAKLLSDWIPSVLQGVEPWLSSEDIGKGTVWFTEISDQLKDTSLGLICLTGDNANAPWILFEAGALSKGLSKSRVCPVLIDLKPENLKPPLSQFNVTLPIKDDMLKLMRVINAHSEKLSLDEQRLEKSFDRWWPDFETKFSQLLSADNAPKTERPRSAEEMLAEVLQIARSIQSMQIATISTETESRAAISNWGSGKSALKSLMMNQFLDEEAKKHLSVSEGSPALDWWLAYTCAKLQQADKKDSPPPGSNKQ